MNNLRGDSKIHLTRSFSVVNTGCYCFFVFFKTVISPLMSNTWLTSHPWARLPLLPTTFPRFSVGPTFHIAGNLTTQIGSALSGAGAEDGVRLIQQLWDKLLFSCA